MFKIRETEFQLILDCTANTLAPSEKAIQDCGQISTGYFWGGVARHLIDISEYNLEGIQLSPENGMFEATSSDKDKLEKLRDLMLSLFNSADKMRSLIQQSRLVFEAHYFATLSDIDQCFEEL